MFFQALCFIFATLLLSLDVFYDDEYDQSDNTDNSGFFSEPSFKHGIMTPDIWDMFKSDWGQKVQ